MRVLMLTWELPPHSAGGMAAQVDGLAHSLAAGGDEVVIITRRSATDRADAMVAGVRVVRAHCDLPWIDDNPIGSTASANHQLVAALGSLDGWTPDVVHAHDWNVAWAAHSLARLTGAPLVTTFHATARSRHGGSIPPGIGATIDNIEWWLALQSSQVITLTAMIQRGAVASFELDPTRVTHIASGIDPTWWTAAGGVDRPGTEPGLVFAWGRVQYEKGFQVLARAIGALRGEVEPLRCIIAGRGSYLPELQSQIDLAQASEAIELAGFVSGHELRDTLHRSQCVVIPSLYEPFGVVALEALASGTPLVASDTGGIAELVGGTGAALTFEPGNADALAAGIKHVLNDRGFAARLASNGRTLIDSSFAWAPVAEETRAVYAAALDR